MSTNRHQDIAGSCRHDGAWFDGWLDQDDWRPNGGRWEAMVRWQTGPADNRMQVFDQGDIRRVDGGELERPAATSSGGSVVA